MSDDLYLHLTDQQRALFIAMLEQENNKKLGISFSNKGEDEENIRRIAYLDGGRDMLTHLLLFDEKLAAQKEQEKQRLLDDTTANPFDQPSF
jgi:hypothetical protein